MSYATVANFKARYDLRLINQLSSDNNSGVGVTANIQASLDDASAQINMAALQGSQYTVLQMTTLVASGDTQLVRMNCDLALQFMAKRRGSGLPAGLATQLKESLDLLDLLRRGERILNITENMVANLPVIINTSALQNSYIQPMASIPFFGGPRGTPTVNGEFGPNV